MTTCGAPGREQAKASWVLPRRTCAVVPQKACAKARWGASRETRRSPDILPHMPDSPQNQVGGRAWWPGMRDTLPWLFTLAVFGVFAFLSGGYVLTRAAPVALVWLVAAAVWVWLMRVQRRSSRLYLAALVALALYALWAGASVLWSFGPDLSWTAFNYAALYVTMAALLGVTPTGQFQVRVAGYGFLAVTVVIGCYAFAGKVSPDVVTHAHTYARLDSPVGYWNVLALLMVMALPVALSLASRRRAPLGLRALAAAAAVPLAFTFFFSYSRGGVIALAVVLVLYFALTDRRLAGFVSLVLVAGPVAGALWRVRDLGTLFSATDDDVLRTLEGHALLRWSLLALAATVVLQLAVALIERLVPWPRALRLAAGTIVIAGLTLGLGGGAWWYVDQRGGTEWLRDRYEALAADSDTQGTGDTAGRLFSLNTGRPPLWRRALEQYENGPRLGTGAGTYRFTHYRFRGTGGVVKHAHSQWLNALSELGLPGLISFAAAMALLVAAAFRGLRRGRRDPQRALLSALQAGLVGFVVHMTWDWDWDMAVAGTALVLVAAAASAYITRRDAPAPAPPRGPALPVRLLASGLLLLLAVSWAPPYLGDRAQNRAVEEAADEDIPAALDWARNARRWNPLSADALITLALIEQQSGDNRGALETLRAAAALQPQNYEVHYQLGLLLERAFGKRKEAAQAFRRALELNPLHQSSAYELQSLAATGGG